MEASSVLASTDGPAPAGLSEAPMATPPRGDTAPAKRSNRYLSLDLWRGLACMLLVVYHTAFYVPDAFHPRDPSTWTVAGGAVWAAHLFWLGVPLFFVVSGYCIAASVDSLQRRPYSTATFFARRIRRIYPPLWAGYAWAIALTCLVAVLVPPLYERCDRLPRLAAFSGWNWAGNLSATETWQHHLTGSGKAFLMPNTWTLCLEEQFYLLCGLLLALSTRRFFAGALFITVSALLLRHLGRRFGVELGGTFLEGHWLSFACGMLVFYQLNRAGPAVRKGSVVLLVIGAGYAMLDRVMWAPTPQARHVDGYLLVACTFALFVGWLRRYDAVLMRATLFRPLFWCGQRSYSIYLTHYPLVVALACGMHLAGLNTPTLWLLVILPTCVAAALAGGWAFHLLVERHFLNGRVGEAPASARTTSVPAVEMATV